MSEQIKKLAEFCDYEYSYSRISDGVDMYENQRFVLPFNPYTDANDTLLVEARLREKKLWGEYLKELVRVCFGKGFLEEILPDDTATALALYINMLMQATLEQRMKAAGKVIQEQVCPECKGLTAIEVDGECGLDLVICPNCKKDEGVGEEQADD